MAQHHEVVVVGGARTAIGKYGGTLKDHPPSDLAALVLREAVRRSGIEASEVKHVVFGNVMHTDGQDPFLSRVAAIKAGLPIETPALTLNRLCGSGLQAVISAAQLVQLGQADITAAGGAESMSRGQYWIPGLRWGIRMNDSKVIDAVVAVLSDPFEGCHIGITAENVAKKWGISRQEQDALACESHRRATSAIEQGRFKEQIVPVEIKAKGGVARFEVDEHVRPDTTIEALAKLKPVFDPNGAVTAGNASGMNDAASSVILMESKAAEKRGLKPLGRLVSYGFAGVDPSYMGIGPVPATRAALAQAGLRISDMDVIELNEAFAAQALAVIKDLELPADRTNPNGSGISLGHPVAATGCILVLKALHELRRIGGRYALVTMCIGGGQGISAIFERV